MEEQKLDRAIPRLIQDGPSRAKYGRIRNSEDYTFFGITKTKNGDAQQSLALKLILQNGKQLAVQYHELMSPMKFNGADSIELTTPTLSVVIKGNNLADIFDYLTEFRLVWLKEPDSDFMPINEDEPEIVSITVEMEV